MNKKTEKKQKKQEGEKKEEVFTKEDFLKALKKASKKQKPSRERGKKGTSE